jgi:hypothetical protein
MAVKSHSVIPRVMKQCCSLVDGYRRLGEIYYLYFQGVHKYEEYGRVWEWKECNDGDNMSFLQHRPPYEATRCHNPEQ